MAKLRRERTAPSRSTAHRSHGIHATDQDKFGKFPVDTTAPLVAKTIAPRGRAEQRETPRQEQPHPECGEGKWQQDDQVEAEDGRRERPQRKHRR